MSILIDDDKIYNLYNEGKLKNIASMAAIGASSLLAAPNVDADISNDQSIKQNYEFTIDNIVNLWSKYYQTSLDPQKEKRAKLTLQDGIKIPSNANKSINIAVDIFGGDMGVKSDILRKLLIYTGEIESGYNTRVQYNGGPARGYWQVEPKTALDHFKTGNKLMGSKFKNTFKKEIQIIRNNNYDLNVISNILENNDNFAASMAAMTWIRQAHNDLSKL